MQLKCLHIQEVLQEKFDESLELPVLVQEHIKGCPECRKYYQTLTSLGESLTHDIDEKLKTIPTPDFRKICRKKNKRLFVPVTAGIAAVIVLGLGIFFSTFILRNKKGTDYIASDVEVFVAGIFSRPLLYDDVSGQTELFSASDWFDDSMVDENFFDDTSLYDDSIDLDIYFTDYD